MPLSSSITLPTDWVLVGARTNSPDPERAYVVLASRELRSTRLETTFDPPPLLPLEPLEPYYCTLQTTLHTYVIAYGASYREALNTIMDIWQPEPADPPAIAPHRQELT